MPGGGSQEIWNRFQFSRIGIWNIPLSQVKDITNLKFLLSSGGTLLIRNKLEMRVFPQVPSRHVLLVGLVFPCGQLGSFWSINLDGNDHCIWRDRESPVLDLGKVSEVPFIRIMCKHTLQCVKLLFSKEGAEGDIDLVDFKCRSAGQREWLPLMKRLTELWTCSRKSS